MTGDGAAPAPRGCAEALASAYDVALLDLDGVVYIGKSAVAGAADALAKARAAGLRVAFVTNNASRTPSAIAAQLTGLGVPTSASDVVTSAQAGARLLAERLPPAAAVLVVGGIGLRVAVRERGFRPVSVASERPAAVIQGYAPDLGYALLAEGALAVQAGALFVVSNADKTLPSARGRQPGNGSLSRVIATATGQEPLVAGKPEPPLHAESVARTGARHPLVVGDRLDTDIEGANAAELPSLMVLTGVNSARDAVYAKPAQRPTYIGHDLRSLHTDGERLAVGPQPGWRTAVADTTITVTGDGSDDGDDLSIVRAVAGAVWGIAKSEPDAVRIEAGDDDARAALGRWSLVRTD
jgi:glycerol-1-phosphatase